MLCVFLRAAFPVSYPILLDKDKSILQCTGDITYNNFSATGAALSFVSGGGGVQLPLGPVFGLPFAFHTFLYVREVFTGATRLCKKNST